MAGEHAPMRRPLPADHEERMRRARLSLAGLSVGDAFGQRFFGPAEEALALIAARRVPPAPWSWTDDTEMALSIVEVLAIRGCIDPDRLAAGFAARFDIHRGYGGMAVRILTEIHHGRPWREVAGEAFGGQGSLGNGSAMRVAPVGAYFADDLARAAEEAAHSAEVTHAHPEGKAGAIAVAVAAAIAARPDPPRRTAFLEAVLPHVPEGPTRVGIECAAHLEETCDARRAAGVLGSGAEITCPDTVPYTLFCASRSLDSFEESIWMTLAGLGDRDTTCAIVGGIVALSVGRVPDAWLERREPVPRV